MQVKWWLKEAWYWMFFCFFFEAWSNVNANVTATCLYIYEMCGHWIVNVCIYVKVFFVLFFLQFTFRPVQTVEQLIMMVELVCQFTKWLLWVLKVYTGFKSCLGQLHPLYRQTPIKWKNNLLQQKFLWWGECLMTKTPAGVDGFTEHFLSDHW